MSKVTQADLDAADTVVRLLAESVALGSGNGQWLQRRIAELLKAERERCAVIAETYAGGDNRKHITERDALKAEIKRLDAEGVVAAEQYDDEIAVIRATCLRLQGEVEAQLDAKARIIEAYEAVQADLYRQLADCKQKTWDEAVAVADAVRMRATTDGENNMGLRVLTALEQAARGEKAEG